MKQPVLISQPEFKRICGMNKDKFHQAKRGGFLPPIINVSGVIPYYNRAEVYAFLTGEWKPENQVEWRRSHRNEMLGLTTSGSGEAA